MNTPMKNHHLHPEGQFYGTATVGEKGQIVIPQEARKNMKLKRGDRLLVFGMDNDMHKLTHKLKELGGRRIAFSLVVLAYLGFLGFINVMMLLPGNWMSAMGHFSFINTGDTHNLIHELVFALIVGTAAVGLFSQLWKPKENFAGQLIAMIAWVTMIFTAAITNNWVPQPLFIIFGGLTLIATILPPAGLGLFNWIRIAKVNKILLTLVVIAAVPLFIFAMRIQLNRP